MTEHLHIQGLRVQAQSRPLLHGLDLQALASGQMVGVLGANGAGKSTLVKALAGRVPAQGQVRWGGHSLDGLSQARRAAWLGYLPQALLQPCRLSVRAVLTATLSATCPGLPAVQREARLQEAVQALQLQPLLDQPLDTLSGGQRQRVGLAQVLVRDTPVLLLDEPTSALDLRWQVETLQWLSAWAQQPGRLVLAVLHDLSLAARFAHQLVLLHEGRLLAQGTPGQVLSPANLRRAYGVDCEVGQRDGQWWVRVRGRAEGVEARVEESPQASVGAPAGESCRSSCPSSSGSPSHAPARPATTPAEAAMAPPAPPAPPLPTLTKGGPVGAIGPRGAVPVGLDASRTPAHTGALPVARAQREAANAPA